MSPVISNTSSLTNLAVIGHLGLVRTQLTSVAVPQAVWQEMLALPRRFTARRLGVPVSGALAIVAAARRAGLIASARTEIARLRVEAGFFISSEVEVHTLRLAGEL